MEFKRAKILGNRKGKSNTQATVITASVVVAVLVLVAGVWNMGAFDKLLGTPTQATAVGGGPAVTQQQAVDSNFGDASTLKVRAYDQQSDSLAQVAATLYVRDIKTGDLLQNAVTMSATASTDFSSSIGSNLEMAAFSSAYYSEKLPVQVIDTVQPVTLKVNAVTPDLLITFEDDDTPSIDDELGNLTLAAGQTDSITSIKFEANSSDRAFQLKGIGLDVATNTNITDVELSGPGLSESGSTPIRLRNTLNYYWVFDQAQFIADFDSLTIGPMKFTADASNNPLETGTLYAVDETLYISAKAGTARQILSGVEDDSASNTNIGLASDPSVTISIE